MQKIPKRVVQISEQLKAGNSPRRFKVRAVLKWFGAARRGSNVLTGIQTTLETFGLTTQPFLDKTGLDDLVRVTLLNDSENGNGESFPESPAEPDSPSVESESAVALGSEEAVGVSAPSEDQLEPEGDDEQPSTKPDDRPVTSQPYDWSISTLRDKLDRGLLDLQPKYQREYVWRLKPELPSRLIESLLLEIPVPPIYFGKIADGRLEVIDGQQRLTTLVNFVTNKFALRKLHRMGSLNGKSFRDLSDEQQEKILDAPIRSVVIDAAGNNDLRYEVFERLNRGSMTLNEQELRNCVYRGDFNGLLAELEKDINWRRVRGGAVAEPRFIERENVLRFFAFANRLPQYGGNLKRFLNDYMGSFAPKDPNSLKSQANFFRQTMQNIYAVFGDRSARLYEVNPRTNRGAWDEKFSIAALDIQASALMNRPTAKVQKVAEQIRELFLFTLLGDSEMQDAISKRTASTVQTKTRWTKFRELVDPIIDGTALEPRFFDFRFRKDLFDKSPLCLLCNNQIHSFEDSTVDHIVPYSRNGKTVPENAQLAHRGCNARKNAQMPTGAQ